MAIKKADLADMFTRRQESEIDALEKSIDERLKSEYCGGTVNVSIPDPYPHPRVMKEVNRRFEESGWTFEVKSDQREGSWLELS